MTSHTAPTPARANAFSDVSATQRRLAIGVATGLSALATVAVAKGLAGFAPTPAEAKEIAVVIHITAVLPAVPLGLYVLLTRKGDARHRLLGKIWMLLMLVTALSALFIRHMNGGNFSFIHLFVPLAIVTMVRAISAARQGRIDAHKRHLVGLFLFGLLLPGLFAFLPGRLLWQWLVG